MIPTPWLIAGGIALLAAVSVSSFTAGDRYCRNRTAAATAQATITIVKSRQGAEAAVNKLDEKALCVELGGGASCE